MRTLRHSLSIALLIVTMSVPEAWAQQQTQQQSPQEPANQPLQPIPAVRSPLAAAADNSAGEDANGGPQELAPDIRPLAGAQDLSLGAPKTGHNFWMPSVDVGAQLYSNPASATNNTGWTTAGSVQGGVDLHHVSGNSDLTLNYLGGGFFSNNSGYGNTIVQQLMLDERLTFHRTTISFMDQLAYLPEAGFGYYGLGGLNLSVLGGIPVQGGFTVNQSILTAQGQRVQNTSLVQVDTFLTPRSSLTFVGSYSFLNYFDNSLDNANAAIFQAGYNYQVTRKDTIAVLYRFGAYRFPNIPQSFDSHVIQFAYARRVTGRMAFSIAGGPDIVFSQIPITGSSGGTIIAGTLTSNTTQVYLALNTGLTYQFRRTGLSLFYFHGVTNGSGVLAGAVTDNVSGAVSRQITRTMNASWTVGYARNAGVNLVQTAAAPLTLTPSNQTFDYWYTGVNLSRRWGRSMQLSLGYTLQYQNSNAVFCVTIPCKTSYVNNQIFVSLGWHPQPFPY